MSERVQPTGPEQRTGTQWGWFVVVLSVLLLAGVAIAVVAMLPLAMATDGCHEGTPDDVCQLTARGQNILVLIPWMCLVAGAVTAVAGAGIAARFRRTPLFGLALGAVGYFAMIPIGWGIAFLV